MTTTLETQTTILLVDDTPANLEVLGGMLKERGYRIRQAISGEMALRAARNNPPDLILLDIMMPDMDGYQTCAELKADAVLREIPVIFISALSETMDKVKAFGAGGVDYITKPFQFAEVEARVATHLALRQQQRQLEAQFRELTRLEELRDNLVHMIVHDMRTPLTGIKGFIELLKMSEMEALSLEGQEFVSLALVATDELIEMVSSLLDVSKMEAGEMALALEPCRLDTIAAEVLQKTAALHLGRTVSLAAPAPVEVVGDAGILGRVVQNLLGNALKFTPEGGAITIAMAPDPTRVRVTVTDTGPGIPEEYRDKIFEKFGQVESRKNHQKHSTGLGLTFCKYAVTAHGGAIGVDSVVGEGSTFWFELPTAGPPAQ
jgi:signal transduction histidine kinase